MRRCAAIITSVGNTHEVTLYHDPTIGELRSLRQRGAIVMYLVKRRFGREVHSTWVTESGKAVVERIDFDV